MPKAATELSALQVRRLSRPGRHPVGGVAGLLLSVKPTGSRSWVLRTTVGAKRRDIGLGGYPEVTLAQARDRAREIKDGIREGLDPVAERRKVRAALIAEQTAALTFDEAASAYHRSKSHEFRSAKHSTKWLRSLELYASPIVGKLPVDAIELGHVTRVLEPIWLTKTDTAKRVRQRMEAVLSWATVAGHRSGENPAAWKGKLEHVLPKPSKVSRVEHFRALPWQQMGAFMAKLRQREGMAARALEFAILTAARSGEVRLATWAEIDLDAKLWTISADRMKASREHRVPLSDAAVAILEAIPRGKAGDPVFPAPKGGALSDMSLGAVCKRMGVDAVPHGFRSTFKDWARSSTSYADEVSELALAHVNSDATRAAYARDELLPHRARLMRDWAKFCNVPSRPGAHVSSIGKATA